MNETISTNLNTEQQPTTPTPEDKGGQGGRTFTQEEVNRIVSDRLAREREKLTQQPQEDEREKALREREEALEARETRCKCEDYLKEVNLSERYRDSFMKLLDVLDKPSFETFAAIVKTVGDPFIVRTIVTGAHTPMPPMNYGGNSDAAIAAAFKPKI